MITPKPSVSKLQPYSPPIESRGEFIRLDFNENLINRGKFSGVDVSVYPEYAELIKKLSSYFGVKRENILPTNGADEAIKTVVDTFVDKGDEVMIIEPTFPMFRLYAQIAGAKIKSIPYSRDFSFPVDKVLENISKKTKLIVIANPNNPTGTLLEIDDVIRILNKGKNSAVLIDEAYADFSGVSCIGLIPKYRNLIVAKSFSKVFGLAGLRLGALVSDEGNIKWLKKVRSPYSVNSMAVKIGIAALNDPGHAKKYVLEIKKNKRMLAGYLRELGIDVYEGHANFLLAGFSKPDKLYNFLKKRGILIRRIPLKGFVRITIGAKKQMQYLMKCMGDYVE
ncbi:MAG TPA: histidinol-phosphate transaminase [Candidatus Nanoarchaeia archaeon]|nr:histidinol-phosphate transaminase [Candidatus Nanoarchaeia archaeon]